MKCRLFLLMVSSFFICRGGAAAPVSLHGRVINEAGAPLELASVMLLSKPGNILVKTELTGKGGVYQFVLPENGMYLLKVSFQGYAAYASNDLAVGNRDTTLADIVLGRNNTGLNAVTITAQKPFVEVKPDMLVINTANDIISAGSSVMDVLARSPGVRIDAVENISLNGKAGVNVMIDGKMQPLSAEELANMLRSMPAASVEKIELISNPSAKYDAAGSAGIINIRTRKDQRMGLNGSVHGSYGQGIYHGEGAGANLNYRKGKINAYASYNYYFREGLNDVLFYRRFYSSGVLNGVYDQHNYTTVPSESHTILAGGDYTLTPNTTVGITFKGQQTQRQTRGFYYSRVLDAGLEEQSYFTTNNFSNARWINYVPNLHIRHAFDSAGRELTADVDYARYGNYNLQDITTGYFMPDGAVMKSPYLLHAIFSGVTELRSAKADYTSPLGTSGHFDAGIKSSYVTADNQPQFYDRSNGGNVYDSSKSDHFIYSEQINAAYANVRKDGKKWSAQAGLRAEQTIAIGDERTTGASFRKDYTQLFPDIALQRHLDKNNDLGVTLSRRIERPNYQQLNPFKFYVDPSTYKEGNPYLNPTLTYNAELSYVYKQRLITTVYYSHISDVITDLVLPADIATHVAKQTEVNLHLVEYYGMTGSYSIPIRRWWNSVNNVNLYYNRYNAFLANTALTNGLVSYDAHSVNSFVLPAGWMAELTVYYQSLQEYGYLNIRPQLNIGAGIQKSLLEKKMTLRFNASDILYTSYHRGYSDFTDYSLSFSARHDNRQLSLSLTYRFGNKELQAIGRHKAGAEDEERRAESNS